MANNGETGETGETDLERELRLIRGSSTGSTEEAAFDPRAFARELAAKAERWETASGGCDVIDPSKVRSCATCHADYYGYECPYCDLNHHQRR